MDMAPAPFQAHKGWILLPQLLPSQLIVSPASLQAQQEASDVELTLLPPDQRVEGCEKEPQLVL